MALDTLDLAMRWLAYPVSAAICANQFDELFMDASYLLRGLHRRERRVVSADALFGVDQQRIAILLPAWKESEVIEQMIEQNLASIEYDSTRYDVFCGTYQNDPETQECVDRLCQRFGTVHKVVVALAAQRPPSPGPETPDGWEPVVGARWRDGHRWEGSS